MRKAKRRTPDVVALVLMLAATLLPWLPRALALDPAVGLGQYQHASWAAREGLMGSVRAIVQTPDGYLWLGTEFGLVRFDGVRFLSWPQTPDQQLPSPRILSLLAARDGTLWIGTFSGLASWKDGRMTRYPDIRDQVTSLLEDHQGTVWLGGKERVCSIRRGIIECRDESEKWCRLSVRVSPAGCVLLARRQRASSMGWSRVGLVAVAAGPAPTRPDASRCRIRGRGSGRSADRLDPHYRLARWSYSAAVCRKQGGDRTPSRGRRSASRPTA